jgi:DNA polymerase (family 10)
MHFTGSKVENIRLRKIAKEKGMTLSEYGLVESATGSGEVVASKTEQEIYAALGEQYKEPWQR